MHGVGKGMKGVRVEVGLGLIGCVNSFLPCLTNDVD
jgi:hypothetical protein